MARSRAAEDEASVPPADETADDASAEAGDESGGSDDDGFDNESGGDLGDGSAPGQDDASGEYPSDGGLVVDVHSNLTLDYGLILGYGQRGVNVPNTPQVQDAIAAGHLTLSE